MAPYQLLLLAVFLGAAASATVAAPGTSTAAPGTSTADPDNSTDLFHLTVVHLNDFHARFDPTARSGGAPCPEGAAAQCVGGLARVAGQARALLERSENALLLNAGDNFQGTLWYSLYRWNVTAALLNLLPWDAFTLGNHEFDDKLAGLVPFIERLDAPVVAANMNASAEPSIRDKFNSSVVVERGGRQIGIIGVVTNATKSISNPEKVEFGPELESVQTEARRLHQRGVKIIIVLSHAGIESDLRMAAEAEHVDLVVGGHSHTLLFTGPPPDPADVPYGPYPWVVRQAGGRTAAVVQAAAYTKYLGRLEAWFDGEGELVRVGGSPILLDSSVPSDPEMEAALAPWRAGLQDQARQVVGHTAVLLEWENSVCGRGECNLGNLVADSHVWEYAGRGEPGCWAAAAVGITNSGGLRAAIDETSAGNITYEALLTTLPFQNTVDLLELQGRDLRDALERAVSNPRRHLTDGQPPERVSFQGFLQVSGLRVTFDLRRPVGGRVVSVEAHCRCCRVPVFEPLEDDTWYRLAINGFLANGGDAYYMFKEKGRKHTLGRVDVDVMQDYLAGHRPVTRSRDGRITVLEGDLKQPGIGGDPALNSVQAVAAAPAAAPAPAAAIASVLVLGSLLSFAARS